MSQPLCSYHMTPSAKVGFISSTGLFLIGIIYILVVAVGVSEAGLNDPITDPTLATMEVLTLMSAILFLFLIAAIKESASDEHKVFGTIALACAVVMAGLTCAVHFITLTAGRQTSFTALEWPSTLYAIELLAWDVFLGLSLLFSALVFDGYKLDKTIRWTLAISGGLALAGSVGPIAGNMALQRIGILGYGIGLPVAALLLAVYFHRGGLQTK